MTKKVETATRKTSATGEAGFTLIELLVVVTILVLMAGLFPMALNRALPSRRVNAATESAWSALRYAQSLSAVSGRAVQVRVRGSEIEIESPHRIWKLTASASLRANSDESAREVLTFYPDGSSDGAIVELRSASRSRLLRVSALTGRIVVDQT